MEGTAPSDFRQVDVDEESRYLVQLDNGEILNELRVVQLHKIWLSYHTPLLCQFWYNVHTFINETLHEVLLFFSFCFLQRKGAPIRILVSNLPPEVTGEQLRQEFQPFGEVTSVILFKNRYDGSSKGLAFVEMLRESGGHAAVRSLNGKLLGEQAIVVKVPRDWGAR
jgi:hypothetical protein